MTDDITHGDVSDSTGALQALPSPRKIAKDQATRLRIKHTAAQILFRQGFEAVTVEAIHTTSEIAKGTFYRKYESKDVLLQHILEEGIQLIEYRVSDAFTNRLEDNRIVDCMRWMMAAQPDDDSLYPLLFMRMPIFHIYGAYPEVGSRIIELRQVIMAHLPADLLPHQREYFIETFFLLLDVYDTKRRKASRDLHQEAIDTIAMMWHRLVTSA